MEEKDRQRETARGEWKRETGREGQAERDRQREIGRERQAEWDRQRETGIYR